MTYRAAHALRRTIIAADHNCTVPRCADPDGYVVRIIWCADGPGGTPKPYDFRSVQEWETWKREHDRRALLNGPRSPLDILIDRACGVD